MLVRIRKKDFDFKRTYLMGVLNITKDSFFDGEEYFDTDKAVKHAFKMIKDGADIIDVGGESTRPGAEPVNPDEEAKRVVPVIEAIRKKNPDIAISIDTYKPLVARKALEAGADMINDIYAGAYDRGMFETAAEFDACYILMHMQGTPATMQNNPSYSNEGIINDIKKFFEKRINSAVSAGINYHKIILDPGIGFGKTTEHNIEILNNLDQLRGFGMPILAGPSRKSFIGNILGAKPDKRLFGTAAVVAYAVIKGANFIRVHDIKEMRDITKMMDAMIGKKPMQAVV